MKTTLLRKRLLVPALLVLAAACIAPAIAQELGDLRQLDLNGDGVIAKDEVQKVLEQRFRQMDTNHDGVLSEDEFVNAGLAKMAQFDTNHDGKITRDEIRAAFCNRLTR